jgi:anti-sigma B factor antagonist
VSHLVASATAVESAEGPFRLIELAGESDMTCRHLKDLLDAEVATMPLLVVVDLSKLTFMDSWSLHTILKAWRTLRAGGGTLVLASPSGEVRRILELSGADTMVTIRDSLQEAVGGPVAPPDPRH